VSFRQSVSQNGVRITRACWVDVWLYRGITDERLATDSGRTDGRTDGQTDGNRKTMIPRPVVGEGIMKMLPVTVYRLPVVCPIPGCTSQTVNVALTHPIHPSALGARRIFFRGGLIYRRNHDFLRDALFSSKKSTTFFSRRSKHRPKL